MSHFPQPHLRGRNPNRLQHDNTAARAPHARRGSPLSNRARTAQRNLQLPYMPPENWYEPTGKGGKYKIVVQNPGQGYRHVLNASEIRARLAQLPPEFTAKLEMVQLSRMTRKKSRFPCYGMQWGTTLYLYPIEETLIEHYSAQPSPAQWNEARMYGGRWECDSAEGWSLIWTEAAIKDFYLNNILIHELGHLLDDRNTRSIDRERYAEWFALEYGYKPTMAARTSSTKASIPRHSKAFYA
ncbi:MAG: hypothetical protein SFX18_13630 [Pirellulales bacterium]|nr:hypothetical protein [Pirellulales bacterium]